MVSPNNRTSASRNSSTNLKREMDHQADHADEEVANMIRRQAHAVRIRCTLLRRGTLVDGYLVAAIARDSSAYVGNGTFCPAKTILFQAVHRP